jgi:K+ transporter
VYSSTFSDGSVPSSDRILGAASLIFWTLTLAVALKYMCVVLFADDNQEGRTLHCDVRSFSKPEEIRKKRNSVLFAALQGL